MAEGQPGRHLTGGPFRMQRIENRLDELEDDHPSSRLETIRRRQSDGDGCRFGFRREVLAGVDEPVLLEFVLLVIQLTVPSVRRQQLGVGTPLHDLPFTAVVPCSCWHRRRLVGGRVGAGLRNPASNQPARNRAYGHPSKSPHNDRPSTTTVPRVTTESVAEGSDYSAADKRTND